MVVAPGVKDSAIMATWASIRRRPSHRGGAPRPVRADAPDAKLRRSMPQVVTRTSSRRRRIRGARSTQETPMRPWLAALLVALQIVVTAGASHADDVTTAETFVGRVEGSNAYIAISKDGTKIGGYLCD